MRIVLKPAALTESIYASVGNLLPHHVGLLGTSIVFPMLITKPILANISLAVGNSAAIEFDANEKESALQKAATRMCCFIVNPLVLSHSRLFPKQRKPITPNLNIHQCTPNAKITPIKTLTICQTRYGLWGRYALSYELHTLKWEFPSRFKKIIFPQGFQKERSLGLLSTYSWWYQLEHQ